MGNNQSEREYEEIRLKQTISLAEEQLKQAKDCVWRWITRCESIESVLQRPLSDWILQGTNSQQKRVYHAEL